MTARPVFLVGFMGAGKTTLGRRVAKLLGRPFVDLDARVERAAGATLPEIFLREGEEGFRAREREALLSLLAEVRDAAVPPVVAAGGGTFADGRNRKGMLEAGLCVWLDIPMEVIRGRIGAARPLYRGPREAERLLREREPAYAEAHIRVPAAERSAAETARALTARIREAEGGAYGQRGGRRGARAGRSIRGDGVRERRDGGSPPRKRLARKPFRP